MSEKYPTRFQPGGLEPSAIRLRRAVIGECSECDQHQDVDALLTHLEKRDEDVCARDERDIARTRLTVATHRWNALRTWVNESHLQLLSDTAVLTKMLDIEEEIPMPSVTPAPPDTRGRSAALLLTSPTRPRKLPISDREVEVVARDWRGVPVHPTDARMQVAPQARGLVTWVRSARWPRWQSLSTAVNILLRRVRQ